MKPSHLKKLAENIDEIARYDLENHKVFGAAYAVYRDGDFFEKCYGTTALNAKDPVTNTTIFRLASMSKPIAAVATLILAERGALSLDDTVDKYLPEFAGIKALSSSGEMLEVKQIPTIRNLLTHTSGIASDPDRMTSMMDKDRQTLENSIAFYVKNGLDFEPNTKTWYSGCGAFDVLAKIVETVGGKDYLTFLKKEVFEPCGMVDTTFTPTAEQQKRMVKMHDRVNGENAEFAMPQGCIFENYPSTHYLGGAGLVSTLSDYAAFAKMLLNKGKTDTGRILKEETLAQMSTPQVSKEIMPGYERWGLGVRVIVEDEYPYLPKGTFGWSGAYGSHFWIDPVNGVFAVYMKNSKFDGGAGNESARNFEKAVYSF